MQQNPVTHSIKATVSSKGQVVIPQPLRNLMGIDAGMEIIFDLHSNGMCELKPAKRSIIDFFGCCLPVQQNDEGHPVNADDRAIMQAVLEDDERSKRHS